MEKVFHPIFIPVKMNKMYYVIYNLKYYTEIEQKVSFIYEHF